MKRIFKITGKVLSWIVGIWLVLLIVLEVILSGPILTKIVNKVAQEFVDGEIHFGNASISMFRRFPAMPQGWLL